MPTEYRSYSHSSQTINGKTKVITEKIEENNGNGYYKKNIIYKHPGEQPIKKEYYSEIRNGKIQTEQQYINKY